jgi:hypothetical protein
MKKIMCIPAAYLLVIVVFGIGEVKATTISSITHNSATIGKYTKYELTFTLSRTYINPFEPCEVDVTVTFHQPDGTDVNIPGFYYRAYTVVSTSSYEYYTTALAISWKARFAPSQLGSYTCDITVKDIDGTATATSASSFTCQESGKKGFIRVDPNQHDFLKYDNGDTRLNIGENIAWNGGGIYGWNNYLVKLHNGGANWVRLWSCIYGTDAGVALEWQNGSYSGYFQGAGKPSLQTSLRMDRYVEIAEQNDIAIQFTFQHHGQFSTSVNADWAGNPYNVTGGGWLSDAALYFSDPCAINLTKNKYRYIIARWGYSPAIFAWELFNEVQFTDAGLVGDQNVVTWHNTMASYIRSIDKFNHPVTTSSYDPSRNLGGLWSLPDINLIQVHYYGTGVIHSLEQATFGLGDLNKPVIIGEFGTGAEGSSQPEPYATQLKEGLELHNGIWSSFHVKSSAHLWSWDSYVDPCNLYGVFTPLAVYAANENLADCNLSIAQRAVSGATTIYANPEIWDYYAMPTQTIFYLQGDCFPGMDKLNQYLHGSWDTARKTDPNFHLNMPTAWTLKIHVESVATGTGSRILRVFRNGTQVFQSSYTPGASNFIISVSLSAGNQSVQIVNAGAGWFHITSYEFKPDTEALLNSIGLVSKQRGYFWIYDVNSQYGLINNGTFHNETVIAKGLSDGFYDVDVYATRGTGGIINSGTANSVSGQLTYTLPDFTQDIAVKVARVVNFRDFAAFAAQWQQTGSNIDADLNHNGNVNFVDFSILAGYWMNSSPANWPF